ncbi:hypothetical protein Gorai_024671, partial [Gossypium raimondii]|nr:hypothetical protein [Gossypium raimondii]
WITSRTRFRRWSRVRGVTTGVYEKDRGARGTQNGIFCGNFKGVMIPTDSLEVVKAIQDFSLADSNSTLIRRIHQLLANVGHWVMQHIPRELNEIANCMAKLAFDTGQNLTMFEKIPKEALAISPIVKTSVSLAQKS